MEYIIRRAASRPQLQGLWDQAPWTDAHVGAVSHFHARSTDHRPQTFFKLLYDDAGVYVHFRVLDRYVRSVQTRPQSPVCTDSCAEFFVQPTERPGYFNFEINAGGAMLLYFIEDPRRMPNGFAKSQPVTSPWFERVKIYHSLPATVEPEIAEPTEWRLEYFVPNEVFEHYVGPLPPPQQRQWRGNFYKCADRTSHPHWASWSPIGEVLSFHLPEYFAPIRFE